MDGRWLTIGQAAHHLGVSVDTLGRWDKNGKLKPARTTIMGRRLYSLAQLEAALGRREGEVWGYARAAGPTAPDSLARQRAMLVAVGVPDTHILDDTAGSLDYSRPAFCSLIERVQDGLIARLVVPYRDTLVGTGHEFIERLAQRNGCSVVVLAERDADDTFLDEILAWAHREQARRFAKRSRS